MLDELGAEAHRYVAYGLTIASELECPELTPCEDSLTPDVWFRTGATPRDLIAPRVRGVAFQATDRQFLIDVRSVARYLVSDGREIVIEPASGSDATSLRVFLLGAALGGLLHQRGRLPLHGSAIETSQGAAIFCGPSGFGKSTLAALFSRRGYRVLADDLACIDPDGDFPRITPGHPNVLLWADSLAHLNIDASGLALARPRLEDKYCLPVQPGPPRMAIPVRAVYVLRTTKAARPDLISLRGVGALRTLTENTYCRRFLKGMGAQNARHFHQVGRLRKHARIVGIHGSHLNWPLGMLVELLEKDFQT